jgi:hypothetical protein
VDLNNYRQKNNFTSDASSNGEESNDEEIVPIRKRNDKRRNEDSTEVECNTVINNNTLTTEIIKYCSGYKSKIDEQFFTYFPFQLLEFNQYTFVIDDKIFHDRRCRDNNYKYKVNSVSDSSNVECYNLKFNSHLKTIFERAVDFNKFNGNKYLNYNQLIFKLDDNAEMINNHKLNNLNKDLMIMNYRNKISLYKRFHNLIVQNDVKRLQQLIKVCLKHGDSISTIINKFNMAVNNTYKPKGWSNDPDTMDLAFLVLRIGGPSLLASFSSQNVLPTSSYIHKVILT